MNLEVPLVNMILNSISYTILNLSLDLPLNLKITYPLLFRPSLCLPNSLNIITSSSDQLTIKKIRIFKISLIVK